MGFRTRSLTSPCRLRLTHGRTFAPAEHRAGVQRRGLLVDVFGFVECVQSFVRHQQRLVVHGYGLVGRGFGLVKCGQGFVRAGLSFVGHRQRFVGQRCGLVVQRLGTGGGGMGFAFFFKNMALGLKGLETRTYPIRPAWFPVGSRLRHSSSRPKRPQGQGCCRPLHRRDLR